MEASSKQECTIIASQKINLMIKNEGKALFTFS